MPGVHHSEEDRERIIAHVLVELAAGRAVSRILREDADMCPKSTFWNWCFNDEDLMGKVARAREFGVEAVLDDAIDIADDKTHDTVKDEQGNDRPNTEWITRSRLRVDTRHKYAQMIAPRKYGPKLDVTSDGKALNLPAEIEAARRRAADGANGAD